MKDCEATGDHPEACNNIAGYATYDPKKSSTSKKLSAFKIYRYGKNYHGKGVDYLDVIKVGFLFEFCWQFSGFEIGQIFRLKFTMLKILLIENILFIGLMLENASLNLVACTGWPEKTAYTLKQNFSWFHKAII
jgi:hypothetical protein